MEDTISNYLLVTTSRPPSSKSIQDESKLPFACIFKPFAPNEVELSSSKDPISDQPSQYQNIQIPLVSFPTKDVVRCFQCKGYINPYCEFIEKGSRWACNLCRYINEVPTEYFSNLDSSGKRIDFQKRPELLYNSIDIIAPESYMNRPPMPCVYLFLIDLSIKAQENDFISLVLATITDLISAKALLGYPRTEVALVFFDKSVHFVSLGSEFPVIYTETECNDIFLPVPADRLLVSIEDIEDKILKVLELSKELVGVPYSTCYRTALKAAGLILQNQGGKIVSFVGEILGENAHPLQSTLVNKDLFYSNFSKELAYWNISLTQFIKTTQFCNLQGLSELSQHNGGSVYFYPHFNSRVSAEKLRSEIVYSLTCLTAWESTVKFRHSSEWVITSQFGNFCERNEGLLGMPVYTYPNSIVYELSPRSVSFKDLYLQSAMLYTSSDGEKKLRIHNLRLITSDFPKDILENANCDALVNLLTKKSLKHMLSTDKAEEGSTYLEARCQEIIKECYRIWGKQPEKLEFFCASILGLLKHPMFINKSYGYNLNMDLFFYHKYLFESLSSEATGILSYPRLYPVHNSYDIVLNLTYKSLETTGAYLLDTGVDIILWVRFIYGSEASPQLLEELFGNPKATTHYVYNHGQLMHEPTLEFIQGLRLSCGLYQNLLVMMSGDNREQHFFSKLVEDPTLVKLTYEEFYSKMISLA